MFNATGLRRTLHTLFGTVLVGALWVTALFGLSSRPTSTAMLTELGANVLNPYLVAHSGIGVSESTYATLQKTAAAHPSQEIPLSILSVQVLGSDIAKKSYSEGVRVIYSKMANVYYDKGPSGFINIPPDVQKIIGSFGLFGVQGASSLPPGTLPSGVSAPQLPELPPFLKPLFTVIGLNPTTLTAAGHANIASILLWWWVAALGLGALAIVFNSSDKRLSSAAWTVFHAGYPLLIIVALIWIFSLFKPDIFAPFRGMFALFVGAFVPVYAGAAVVGALGLIPTLLARFRGGAKPGAPREAAPVPAGGSIPMSGMPPGMYPPTSPGAQPPAGEMSPPPYGSPMPPYGSQPPQGQ
ncbi:MAG TPA: hypothetical protein VJR48_14390 [Ktedonobacterales bacterium]|nr:hypothetical protein [Ktedonobacterales bacterium]